MEEQDKTPELINPPSLHMKAPVFINNAIQLTMDNIADFGFQIYRELWNNHLDTLKKSEHPQDIPRNWYKAQEKILEVIEESLPEVKQFLNFICNEGKVKAQLSFIGFHWALGLVIDQPGRDIQVPQHIFISDERSDDIVKMIRSHKDYLEWKNAYTLFNQFQKRENEDRISSYKENEIKSLTQKILIAGSMNGDNMAQVKETMIKEFSEVIKRSTESNLSDFPWFL